MKIRRRKLVTWGYIIAAGWFLAVMHAHGAATPYNTQVKAGETKYRTPEDMIDMVPVLNKLPRTLRFGQGYIMKLSPEQLRINHQSLATRRNHTPKNCTLGLSYVTAVGGSLSSRIDLPIFSSSSMALSDWSRSNLADYAVCMSRTPADRSGLKIALSARF